ncbi:MAG: thioredoxin [Bacilli bacterium]|nr:thioredoxin [Bacilli bacterium]
MDFEKEVLKSDKKVLVDFNATWCGPCRMLAPIIEEIGEERKDIKVISIDVDENEELAREYGIFSIPCLIVFANGKEINRSVGYKDKDSVLEMLGE